MKASLFCHNNHPSSPLICYRLDVRSFFRIYLKFNLFTIRPAIIHSFFYRYITDKGAFYVTTATYLIFLNVVSCASAPSVYIPLGGVNDMFVCVSVYVLWIFQRAHLVAMCQCHWPLCSPSAWYTHSASSDSCSIRGPSCTTDTQTQPRTHKA